MPDEIKNLKNAWQSLQEGLAPQQWMDAYSLAIYFILGGALGLLVRILYRYCSASPSNAESITRIFPILTMITTAVIGVVKASVALSLGLVGALSIVRFRAAIKEPEELVYLFLCIAIGLCLGAEQPLLAVTLTLVVAIFVIGMHFLQRKTNNQDLLLTITGAAELFAVADGNVLSALEKEFTNYQVQRLDVDGDRGQVRVYLPRSSSKRIGESIGNLQKQLKGCEISYVNIGLAL